MLVATGKEGGGEASKFRVKTIKSHSKNASHGWKFVRVSGRRRQGKKEESVCEPVRIKLKEARASSVFLLDNTETCP